MKRILIEVPPLEVDRTASTMEKILPGCDIDQLHMEVAQLMKISSGCESHAEAMEKILTHLGGVMTIELAAALTLVIGHGCQALEMETHIKKLQESGELPEEIAEAMENGTAQVVGMRVAGKKDDVDEPDWGGNSGNGSGSVH